MRHLLARNSETVYERPLSQAPLSPAKAPAKASDSVRKAAKASRKQLASDRIREKIHLAKIEAALKVAQPSASVPQSAEAHQAVALRDETSYAAGEALPAPLRPATSRTKRLFDILGAAFCLLALAPVMISLAILVRRDGGPAIFGHRRIGSDGKTFLCLKFRSMCTDAERKLKEHLANDPAAQAEWDKDFKLKDDPRITSLGQLLRRTSLDELPQLFNVLRGEMSLVGPRPIVADEVPRYGDRFIAYRNCRPGITGLWQVSGRNDISYRARVRLDSFYAARWSMAKDVFILIRTVGVVFRRSGAY
jgi:undecaprenyl-phosphate galactose phosphotransferase